MTMNRRTFIRTAAAIAAGSTLLDSCAGRTKPSRNRVIVLGVDGMDPTLTERFLARGIMPNLATVIDRGGFSRMATTMPPQSPVAWSTIITGAPPGVHGIYDFIHRDPADMLPYFSLSRIAPPERTFDIGSWAIPLEKGESVQLRQGTPFWTFLEQRDIPAALFRIPANFPVAPGKTELISGLGTPDLRGGYGNCTVFTTAPGRFPANMDGGRVIPVSFSGSVARTGLPGPSNTLKRGRPEITVPLAIWRDAVNDVVRLVIGTHDRVLRQGEWTGWMKLKFPAAGPLDGISAIVKMYVKSVHPDLTVYVSPINIDPADPALPFCSPDGYSRELAKRAGAFYTQGLPNDTNALSNGVLDESEYLALAGQVFDEENRLLALELDRFARRDAGLLFFYYSAIDQNSHMYWRFQDRSHPMYDPALEESYGGALESFYTGIDRAIGSVLEKFDPADPSNTIMIISDHGFASFRRQVNLNTWLYGNGLIALTRRELDSPGYFTNVDWLNTEAYAVGINSLYLNIRGRERYGGLNPSLADRRRESMRSALLELADPKTGERAVREVRIVPEEERRVHPHAPDLIVGWNEGFRTSWASVLGGFTPEMFMDNTNKWSGDHCMAPSCVPAVLISNRRIAKAPELSDISAGILSSFGIARPDDRERMPLFS